MHDCNRKDYDTSAHDEFHHLRRHRGFAKKDSEAVLGRRLSALGASDRKRGHDTQDELPDNAGKRNRVD